MDRRGRRDAGFRDLRGDVDREAEALAQLRRLDRRTHTAELDQLERDTPGAAAFVGLDVGERMDAFVGADRNRRDARQPRKRVEIRVRERLLDEQQAGLTHAFDIAAGISQGQPAIGIGAERSGSAEAFSQRERRRDLAVDRLGADLELEEAKALRAPCMRFGDVLLGRGIAEKPHWRDRAARGAANEIDYRQAG
jgi:hypothetical protein